MFDALLVEAVLAKYDYAFCLLTDGHIEGAVFVGTLS